MPKDKLIDYDRKFRFELANQEWPDHTLKNSSTILIENSSLLKSSRDHLGKSAPIAVKTPTSNQYNTSLANSPINRKRKFRKMGTKDQDRLFTI